MAIETVTIQVRRGKEAELDKTKFLPGEFGVTTDTHKVFATTSPGRTKELASKDEVEGAINEFTSTVDQKVKDAVDSVAEELDNAIVGIENKTSEALEQIPEDYTALDAEVKALRKELDVSAPGIIEIADGVDIVITDSSDKPFVDFALDGKGEQKEIKGYQLFDKETGLFNGYFVEDGVITASNTAKSIFVKIEPNTTYTIQKLSTTKFRVLELDDIPQIGVSGNILHYAKDGTQVTITTGNTAKYILVYVYSTTETENGEDVINSIMINEGTEALPWEPYTNGIASPNPEYPQEIVNVGRIYQLFDASEFPTRNINGATITNNGNGSFTVSGSGNTTAPESGVRYQMKTEEVSRLKAGKYHLALNGTKTMPYFYVSAFIGNTALFSINIDGTFTLTEEQLNNPDFNLYFGWYALGDREIVNGTCRPVVYFEGSGDGTYRPYTGMYETEVVVRGKNLFENTANSKSISGITFTVNEDKSITANGTAEENVYFEIGKCSFAKGTYYLNGCPKDGGLSKYYMYFSGISNDFYNDIGEGVKAVFDADIGLRAINIRIAKGITCNNINFYPMIRLASITDGTYEPYTEQTAIITTPEPLRASKDGSVRDKVCLDGTIERNIRHVVLSPSDDIISYSDAGKSNGVCINNKLPVGEHRARAICTHSNKMASFGLGMHGVVVGHLYGKTIYWLGVLDDLGFSTLEQFIEWLHSNTVSFDYVTSKPFTEELNAESKQALQALRTNYHNTVVTNDQDTNMEVDYVADTKLYIDNLISGISAAIIS